MRIVTRTSDLDELARVGVCARTGRMAEAAVQARVSASGLHALSAAISGNPIAALRRLVRLRRISVVFPTTRSIQRVATALRMLAWSALIVGVAMVSHATWWFSPPVALTGFGALGVSALAAASRTLILPGGTLLDGTRCVQLHRVHPRFVAAFGATVARARASQRTDRTKSARR